MDRSFTVTALPALLMMACAGCGDDGAGRRASGVLADAAPEDSSEIEGAAVSEASIETGPPDEPMDLPDAGPPAVDVDGRATSDCPIAQTEPAPAQAARSGGYVGTDVAYYALYGAACKAPGDCVPACAAAGGTMLSCSSGSQCLPGAGQDGGAGCVPPPVWLTVAGALSESGMTSNAAQLTLVSVPYVDELRLSQFGVSIPDGATITGIQVEVRKATLSGNAVDDTVRLMRDGSPTGSSHAQSQAWPTALTVASYGGAYETWGTTWTVADVRSAGFGVSIAPKYTGPPEGNERAYVDSVRLTVFYTTPCE